MKTTTLLLVLLVLFGGLLHSRDMAWRNAGPLVLDTLTVAACSTYTSPSGLYTWTTSGTYQDTLSGTLCDTLLTIHLTIGYQPSVNILIENPCGSSYTLNDTTYTISGIHTQILTNAVGCDSVLTVYLNLFHLETYDTLTVDTCDTYTLNGQTYSTSGTYTQLLTNWLNCDSFLTLNLTIHEASQHLLADSSCESYSFHDSLYTQSGLYTHTLTNQAGCDSLISLDVTIHPASQHLLTASACESYALNDSLYTVSGTYEQILMNEYGCDSTLTLDLRISQASQSYLDSIVVCDAYSLNDSVYTSSGMYTQLLTNAEGCDSSILLDLTIEPLHVSLTSDGWTIFAHPNFNSQYQWVNCDSGYLPVPGETNESYSPVADGNYAVIVTNGNCRDTSACMAMTITSLDQSFAHELRYFPSPSSGVLTIDLGGIYRHIEIDIQNAIGQQIGTYRDQSRQKTSVRLPTESGIYMLQVQADDRVAVIKVVRE
ncbi:MAG: T9SS type A sorting domain-containing protein [Bacteroidota bacterium]